MFVLGYVSVYTTFILHCTVLTFCTLCSHVIISRSYYLICVPEILQLNFSCSEQWLFNCESGIRGMYTVEIHCLIHSGLRDCFTVPTWAEVVHWCLAVWKNHISSCFCATIRISLSKSRPANLVSLSGSHERLLSLPSVCGCREEADCTYVCTCIQTHRHCIVVIVVAVVRHNLCYYMPIIYTFCI